MVSMKETFFPIFYVHSKKEWKNKMIDAEFCVNRLCEFGDKFCEANGQNGWMILFCGCEVNRGWSIYIFFIFRIRIFVCKIEKCVYKFIQHDFSIFVSFPSFMKASAFKILFHRFCSTSRNEGLCRIQKNISIIICNSKF